MDNHQWITINGVVSHGHQVASGKAQNSSYPDSTIRMQKPLFQELGLDLTGFYDATLNVSIAPYIFSIEQPEFTFRQVEWTSLHPPEDFSFSRCKIIFNNILYEGWIYYPHPGTKKTHFQEPSIIEIIAPLIPEIQYGNEVQILLDESEVSLKDSSPETWTA